MEIYLKQRDLAPFYFNISNHLSKVIGGVEYTKSNLILFMYFFMALRNNFSIIMVEMPFSTTLVLVIFPILI